MQNDVETHDTEFRAVPPLVTLFGLDHVVPSHVSALPPLSTATQNEDDEHEIDWSALESIFELDQLVPSHVNALPLLSIAAQKLEEVHDMEERSFG